MNKLTINIEIKTEMTKDAFSFALERVFKDAVGDEDKVEYHSIGLLILEGKLEKAAWRLLDYMGAGGMDNEIDEFIEYTTGYFSDDMSISFSEVKEA